MGKKCLSLEWTIIIQTVTQNTQTMHFFQIDYLFQVIQSSYGSLHSWKPRYKDSKGKVTVDTNVAHAQIKFLK